MRLGTLALGSNRWSLDVADDQAGVVHAAQLDGLLTRLIRDTWQPRRAPHWVIVENRRGNQRYEAHALQERRQIGDGSALVANVDVRPNVRLLLLNYSFDCYAPANQQLPARTPARPARPLRGRRRTAPQRPPAVPAIDRRRWVLVPRVLEFYLLPPRIQRDLRNDWAQRLAAARLGYDRRTLSAISTPELRILVARYAANCFRVRRTDRGNQRGGFTTAQQGTLPLPSVARITPRDRAGRQQPLTATAQRAYELECYLTSISQQEGRIEAINAYDLCAGISLGPIQFNAIRALLFEFLKLVRDNDPRLLESAVTRPLHWSLADHAATPAVGRRRAVPAHLDVQVGRTAAQRLHGLGSDPDRDRNVRYLQSGRVPPPRRTGTCRDAVVRRELNVDFRVQLTHRFRDLVAWPNVHPLIERISLAYLSPGLGTLARNQVPAIDVTRLDRDTYVLKAILMSANVRYASAIPVLTRGLQGTPSARLQALERLLADANAFHRLTAPPPLRLRGRSASEAFRRRLCHAAVAARRRFPLIAALTAAARGWGAPTP